jgi:hypothetical protein
VKLYHYSGPEPGAETTESSSKARLYAFKPQHSFLVGIESDGCVFDTMEIKHKECFITNIIIMIGGAPGELAGACANGAPCFSDP